MIEPATGRADEPPPAASLASIAIGRRSAAPKPGGIALGAAAAPSTAAPRTIEELVAAWHRLRTPERLPSPAALDASPVARDFPNTVLLSFDTIDAPPQAVRLTGPGAGSMAGSAITLTPDLAQWVLDLARAALRIGDIVREQARFPEPLEAILVPLSRHGRPDHVLYHLRRV